MKKTTLLSILLMCAFNVQAQPDIVQQLQLNDSVVRISVELENGHSGTGTGVVVSKEYVVTNCHVLANSKGANVAKYGDGYRPIALKADWKHDLCALKFDGLPFKPVKMRDSSTLETEEEVFSMGYPNGNMVPQPSFGNIKAKYAYDGSLIIRSNAAFSLGSSGGALFDQQNNLIGITTFKSPGPQGFFYSLPVEWIKQLVMSKELNSLMTNESPFWALPAQEQPYFMKVVIPHQNHEWSNLKLIAKDWLSNEPNSSDAWYYLGISNLESGNIRHAKTYLAKAISLDPRNLDALMSLSQIALYEIDFESLNKINAAIQPLSIKAFDDLNTKISELKNQQPQVN